MASSVRMRRRRIQVATVAVGVQCCVGALSALAPAFMGEPMRKFIIFPALLAIIGLIGLVANSSGSAASPTSVDLSITGAVVAGVTSAEGSMHVPFSFTVTNRSGTAADIVIGFTLTGGSAPDGRDYVCPLVGTGADINPDGTFCEPGLLAGGRSTSAAIIATPTATGTMTVQACVSAKTRGPDSVPSNNCKSLSIRIE
jgi:hypothetical protein